MSELEKQIDQDIIKALKSGDKERLTVLRGLKSDIKYRRIEKGADIVDDDVIATITSSIKKRRDSVEQFGRGGRDDLVKKEQFGIDVLQQYLPEQLTEEELRTIVKKAIDETGADSPQKIGLVMKAMMPKLKGRADGKQINKIVQEMLS